MTRERREAGARAGEQAPAGHVVLSRIRCKKQIPFYLSATHTVSAGRSLHSLSNQRPCPSLPSFPPIKELQCRIQSLCHRILSVSPTLERNGLRPGAEDSKFVGEVVDAQQPIAVWTVIAECDERKFCTHGSIRLVSHVQIRQGRVDAVRIPVGAEKGVEHRKGSDM